MKAIFIEQPGGIDALHHGDQPTPEPKAGEALIRLAASGARGATTIAASQMLGAVAMLALYGALDQVMGLRPMRKGAAL